MELLLIRTKLTTKSTIGKLYIDGQFYCYTLEDVDRGLSSNMTIEEVNSKKVKTLTAIPRGKYDVIVNLSNRFKIEMPLLLNVKGYEGVRIHKGNKSEETEGCILVGLHEGGDMITDSKLAYDPLLARLKSVLKAGDKVILTIQ